MNDKPQPPPAASLAQHARVRTALEELIVKYRELTPARPWREEQVQPVIKARATLDGDAAGTPDLGISAALFKYPRAQILAFIRENWTREEILSAFDK